MLVKIIKCVDDNILLPLLAEISEIRWETITDSRSQNYIFSTSKSIGIRVPKVTSRPPTTVREWSEILDCVDNLENKLKYINCYRAVEWIYEQVNGIALGRIMIVNLLPGGCVAPHVDPGTYFSKYSRFHIPLITNEQVVFSNSETSPAEHMPYGYLCQLNNLDMHMVRNNSNHSRIHIIADIEVSGGNYIF